jgi:hypothetical protein
MNKISLKLAASEAFRLPLAGIYFDHANVGGTAAKAAADACKKGRVKFSANRK